MAKLQEIFDRIRSGLQVTARTRPVDDPGDSDCAWCGWPIQGPAKFACDENGPYQGHGLCSQECASRFETWELRAYRTALTWSNKDDRHG